MSVTPRDIYESVTRRRSEDDQFFHNMQNKLEEQVEATKNCEKQLESYGTILGSMDRMLMEYDNQLTQCQMKLSKYDGQLEKNQELLKTWSEQKLIPVISKKDAEKPLLTQEELDEKEFRPLVDQF